MMGDRSIDDFSTPIQLVVKDEGDDGPPVTGSNKIPDGSGLSADLQDVEKALDKVVTPAVEPKKLVVIRSTAVAPPNAVEKTAVNDIKTHAVRSAASKPLPIKRKAEALSAETVEDSEEVSEEEGNGVSVDLEFNVRKGSKAKPIKTARPIVAADKLKKIADACLDLRFTLVEPVIDRFEGEFGEKRPDSEYSMWKKLERPEQLKLQVGVRLNNL
jgi:hypothetical protein